MRIYLLPFLFFKCRHVRPLRSFRCENACLIDYYQNTDVWTFPNNRQIKIM